jgi:hypothetical protein
MNWSRRARVTTCDTGALRRYRALDAPFAVVPPMGVRR